MHPWHVWPWTDYKSLMVGRKTSIRTSDLKATTFTGTTSLSLLMNLNPMQVTRGLGLVVECVKVEGSQVERRRSNRPQALKCLKVKRLKVKHKDFIVINDVMNGSLNYILFDRIRSGYQVWGLWGLLLFTLHHIKWIFYCKDGIIVKSRCSGKPLRWDSYEVIILLHSSRIW